MMPPLLSRRTLLAVAGLGGALAFAGCGSASPKPPGPFKVSFTPAQWRARLSPEAYYVLREEGTERSFSSPLNNEHRVGTFVCAGCALPLFASTTKFDSGTGWPSFWTHLPGAIGSLRDTSYGMVRTAVYCTRCGGHQGHVFDDGPKPTGLRYCINGVALAFVPKA